MEFLVKLSAIENVKKFVRFASNYNCDIFVKSQDKSYIVDGSSIMGVLSLDLRYPIAVCIKDIESGEDFKNDVSDFVIN